jgi:hypothetical protein
MGVVIVATFEGQRCRTPPRPAPEGGGPQGRSEHRDLCRAGRRAGHPRAQIGAWTALEPRPRDDAVSCREIPILDQIWSHASGGDSNT